MASCSISSVRGSEYGSSVSILTQVPQLLESIRGTGIILAVMPVSSHCFLQRIAPKWEKKVAIQIISESSG